MIFFIFFQSNQQVGMKNIVKCYKEFFGYFNALETNGESGQTKLSYLASLASEFRLLALASLTAGLDRQISFIGK